MSDDRITEAPVRSRNESPIAALFQVWDGLVHIGPPCTSTSGLLLVQPHQNSPNPETRRRTGECGGSRPIRQAVACTLPRLMHPTANSDAATDVDLFDLSYSSGNMMAAPEHPLRYSNCSSSKTKYTPKRAPHFCAEPSKKGIPIESH